MPSVSQNLANVPWNRSFNGFGEAAIKNTVAKMKYIITESGKNPYIRRWAEKILSEKHVAPYDWIGEIRAIHNWTRDNIRYTHDPKSIEWLQTPPTLLALIEQGEIPMGDCDDMSMLSLSLLKSIGYNVALRIASYNPSKKFQHVYGLVQEKSTGHWIPVECIKPDKELGFEAPNATRIATFEV